MDYKIIIDPGHGGEDFGITTYNTLEKDLCLAISKHQKEKFVELNISVDLIRTQDILISTEERLAKIAELCNEKNKIIMISNHMQQSNEASEIITDLNNDNKLSKMISQEFLKEGQLIDIYKKRLPSNPDLNFYTILNSNCDEHVLINYGFKSNLEEITKEINWEDLANAVVRGVMNYIKKPYEIENLNTSTYTVKKGDTLWSIAKKSGISVELLKKLNQLKDNLLNVGQSLITSLTSEKNDKEETYKYIVKEGDTIYSLAKHFNIRIKDIMEANNLASTQLNPGMELSMSKISD